MEDFLAKKELIHSLLATKDREELLKFVELVRRLGEQGTWDKFLKDNDPRDIVSSPSGRTKAFILSYLCTLETKNDLLLLAKLLRPTSCLIYDYSQVLDGSFSRRQDNVRDTLIHEDYAFEFLSPSSPKDWVATASTRKMHSFLFPVASETPKKGTFIYPQSDDMLSLCCETALCQDGSDCAIRVVLVDTESKVVLDKLLKPNQPLSDYKPHITGLSADKLKTAPSLSDIQQKLLKLFSLDTIIVGHRLHKDLKALKMDHARVIDASLLCTYRTSDVGSDQVQILPRPSLKNLYKCLLNQDLKEYPDRCVHYARAVMRVLLASESKRVAPHSIEPTKEMLEAMVREEKRASLNKQKMEENAKKHNRRHDPEEEKNVSSKKQRKDQDQRGRQP